ncbi:LuxR C-terminal-related transcriptional regulator [Streptomyces sp. NPDC056660]|uniref:helix-turn-helix transcriptional regulator n=1 Tax=Streptomyces sp. NPDC056660 TaxID=3345897 RepID=UPI0036768F83
MPQTAPSVPPDTDLVGRLAERERLAGYVALGRVGGVSVVLEGEAGIGKSALLSWLASRALEDGYRVLRCTGLEQASPVGYSALHELLHPILGLIDALPRRQREALTTAFGLTEGPSADRLLVSIAALGLLEEAAASTPVCIAIEDLQWVDRSTARVLDFVALHLAEAPMLVAATGRPVTEPGGVVGGVMERLPIAALDADAAEELLARVAGTLRPATRARVLREAGGNPLAIRELATALNERGTPRGLAAVLPITGRLQHALLGRLAQVPPRSRELLLLAAVADDAGMPDILEAARLLDLTSADLTPLETDGLLRVAENRPVFRHPLLRAAIQGAASTASVHRAHWALAQTLKDPVRAAWHRASSTFERDEAAAAAVAEAGRHAQARGALAEAAAAYQRAAQLSEQTAHRAARLAMAADAARAAGLSAEALEILEEAEGLAADAATTSRLAVIRSTLSLTTGLTHYSRASRSTGPSPGADAESRAEVLWAAALNARGRNLPAAEWRRIEDELRALDTASPLKPIALAVLAPLGHVEEDLRALLPQLVPEMVHRPLGMISLAVAAESLQDLETALTCWGLSLERFHELGAPADEVQSLRGRAGILLLRGRIREGLADAEYAARMARDTAQPLMESMCVATVARARAMLGEPEATSAALRRLHALASQYPLAMASADARWAAGIVALAGNQYRDALIEFTHMSVHPTRSLWAIADRTEAAVRAGRADSIRQNLAQAEQAARAYRSSFLTSLVERGRALLADADGDAAGAQEHFARAVQAGELSESPFELARTHLLFGEWLRRERRPAEARAHLSGALSVFESVDAKMLAERAAAELRAAGEAPRRPDGTSAAPAAALTPQELQVARLAAQGLSNKEIADRVYLSHRTVSTHLYKVFPKLGIASRAQLRDALQGRGEQAS